MTSRLGYFIGFAICAGLIAFAYYLQYFAYENPCPLCLVQRALFMLLGIVFLAGALHGPGRAGTLAYSGLTFIVAAAGATVATRHVWLQHLPEEQVPACGPGLDYLLDRFPLGEVLKRVFAGSGECAEAGWRFLGLSIAEWSLVWFVLLAVFTLVIALRTRASARSAGAQ